MSFQVRLALITCALSLLSFNVHSAHLAGGDLTYKCLGGDQYEISLHVYKNAGVGNLLENAAKIYAVDLDNNTVQTFVTAPRIRLDSLPRNNIGCVLGTTLQEVQDGFYRGILDLPTNNSGYDIVYNLCCRTAGATNMDVIGSDGANYILTITREGLLACSSGPVFKKPPPILGCIDFPFQFDHSAPDADGDEVVYSFCTPLKGGNLNGTCYSYIECPAQPFLLPPYVPISFNPGYSEQFQWGITAPDPIVINSSTGLMTGTIDRLGGCYVSICIEEYRNGVLLSRAQRDWVMFSQSCTITLASADVIPPSNCNSSIEFINNSIGATDYIWDFGDGNTSTDETPMHSYSSDGTYIVTLIANNLDLCSDTIQLTVEVAFEDAPMANFQTDNICAGSNYTFNNLTTDPSGVVTGYEWTIEGNTYSDFEPTVLFNDTGTIDVQLVAITDTGCIDTIVQQMNIRGPSVLDVDIGDLFCSNLNVAFINNSSGYIESVLWDFGDGNTSTEFEPVHDYATQGNYTVTVTLFNSVCGNQIYSETTEVQSAPPIDLGPPMEICAAGITTFTLDTTGFGNASISWSTGDTGPTANLTGGLTSLTVTVDNSGCVTIDSVAITNSAPISVNINVPDINCQGSQMIITNTSSGDIDGILWDFGDGNTSTNFSPVHTYASNGVFVVSATLTNATCGNEFFSDMVDVRPAIPIDLGPPIDVCNGVLESYTIDTTGFNGAIVSWNTGETGPTATFSGGIATLIATIDNMGCISSDSVSIISSDSIIVDVDIPDTYCSATVLAFTNNSSGTIESISWDFGDGNTSNDFAPTHNYSMGGIYTVTVDLVNSVCGSKSYSEDIQIKDPVNLDLGAPRDVCIGSIEVFTIDTTGYNGASILWSTGETTPSISVTGGTLGNVSVTVDNGCSTMDDVDINTIDSIGVDVIINNNYCSGINITLVNNSTGDIESVLWDFGDGGTSTDFSPTYNYTTGGQYTISVDLINTVCGSKSYSKDVNVLSPVSIELGPDRDICVGSTEVFSIDTTGFGNATILWSTGETTPSINVTGGILTDLSVTVNNGCDATDMLTINNFDSIALDIQLDDSYCAASDVVFTNNSTGDIESILWDFGDGATSTEFSPSHNYTSGGQFTVTADLINNVCGSKYFTKDISLVAPIPVDLGPSRDICPGLVDSFLLDTTGFNGASVTWSTGETGPQVYVVGGAFGISVTVDNGCITSDQVVLTSECEIFTPTAFLPGGINSTFNVLDVNIEEYELRIYNRWGEELFSTSSFDIGWDGSHDGVPAEMDVYVYIIDGIKVGGTPFLTSGVVALIR